MKANSESWSFYKQEKYIALAHKMMSEKLTKVGKPVGEEVRAEENV